MYMRVYMHVVCAYKIGERLDASEQRFGNLVDLLKDQRSELSDKTSETNVNLVDLFKDQRSELPDKNSETNVNPLRGGTFQTLGGAGVASVSSSGDSQMGSGKSIQQQKHEYYIQEGKYVHQNISGVRLSDAKQDVSSKKVRQIQPVVQKQKHEVEPTKHRKFSLP